MDDNIRALERAQDWERLKVAYRRAGMLKELNDLNISLIKPLTLTQKAWLWMRKEDEETLGLRHGFDNAVQGPRERCINLFYSAAGPWHSPPFTVEMEGINFRMEIHDLDHSRKPGRKVECPACKRWITFPYQFRAHLQAKHKALL